MRFFTLLMVTLMTFGLSGCFSFHKTEDYADQNPKIDIRQFFNGKLEAWGELTDFKGKVSRTFYADMEGKFDAKGGELHEVFQWNDGERQTRTWKITFKDENHFTGTADDVVGTAEGTQHGNAANMKYTLAVKRDGGSTIELSLNDWMFLAKEGQVINHIVMKKLGFKVAELNIAIRKVQ